MRDAESPHPICGDQYAKRFMDEQGMEIFRQFGGERGPNASNVARHRYIDDFLRTRLAAGPGLQIILLGCGFDSRAFRLEGGTWWELDEPQLIAYKNTRLPASEARNPLKRIPIDFAAESLQEKLQPLASAAPPARTVIVIEGVTMYLSVESLRATLETLKSLFPRHEVIADLMSAHFIERYGHNIRRIIAQLGARMIPPDAPAVPFQQAGYHQQSSEPIIGLIFRYRSLRALNPLLRLIIPGGYSGYTMRVFSAPGS